MDWKVLLVVQLKNCVAIACWTALAIYFGKWWIALFCILFLTLIDGKDDDNE